MQVSELGNGEITQTGRGLSFLGRDLLPTNWKLAELLHG